VGLHWIALLKPIAVTVPWIMYPAWPAAAAYLALFPALVGALVLALRVRRGLPVAATLPAAWIAGEKLRGLGELGFPWLWLGYSQWENLPVLQWSALGGPLGVGLLMAGASSLVLEAVLAWPARRRRAFLFGGAALAWLAGVALGGRFLAPGSHRASPPGIRVAVIQGNVPGEVKWDATRNREVLDLFLSMSREALAGRPALVIWPETATGSFLARDPVATSALEAFVDSSGVDLLTGYPDYRYDDVDVVRSTNSAGVFVPRRGLVAQYDKIHLVPFGERLPFQSILPALGRLDLGQAEFTPGDSLVLLPAAGRRAAVLVCFESIFPEVGRAARCAGATLLVNVTNDEWFGDSGALYQHAAMSVFRAVETRLPLVRCANTGLSFFVDPDGRVHQTSGAFTREIRLAGVPPPGPAPPFARLGDLAGTGCLALTAALLLVAVARAF
jgi:apolipoprotein N-acyltransferase